MPATMNASLTPDGSMELLSRDEVVRLKDTSQGGLHHLFRRCSLAVLNSGQMENSLDLFERYSNFDIHVIQRDRGIKLQIQNAPASAFVDGHLIKGLQEHLFSVLRDIIFVHNQLSEKKPKQDSGSLTNTVFDILRNAGLFEPGRRPDLAVCWGGHNISRDEYEYTKEVGYQLGLRNLDIVTGCGLGAMKGPMKGAAIGHTKQRRQGNRYIGISEPGIIESESPNAIVNNLVVMPDIEKRLEAFVRLGHAVIVFPGGVGTLEEILYILGVLSHPANANVPFPLFFAGAPDAEGYYEEIERFLRAAIADDITERYTLVVDDPERTAREVAAGVDRVRQFRTRHHDAFYFNWQLTIPTPFQQPFKPSHRKMQQLQLSSQLPAFQLTANLRRAFSGIVAGNVKHTSIMKVADRGPFPIRGDKVIVKAMERLLDFLIAENRMKASSGAYHPCFTLQALP